MDSQSWEEFDKELGRRLDERSNTETVQTKPSNSKPPRRIKKLAKLEEEYDWITKDIKGTIKAKVPKKKRTRIKGRVVLEVTENCVETGKKNSVQSTHSQAKSEGRNGTIC